MNLHRPGPGPFTGALRRRSFIAGAAALPLAGCGGGAELLALIPGVGTGGTGIVAGVVTGLGSVFVDGRRYDDSQAVIEHLPDLLRTQTLAWSDLQLGQYVYLHVDALGTPMRVRLESQLAGPATRDPSLGDRFSVWGQQVQVNADGGAGPVTVFAGLSGVGELAPLDAVQVYGVLQPDPADASRDIIRATRVERIARAAVPARVTGRLRPAANGWTLGEMALGAQQVASLVQQGALAAGTAVTAAGPWPADSAPAARWSPTVLQPMGSPRFAADRLRVSGAAQPLAGSMLLVQGVPVDLARAAPAVAAAGVAAGSYVTVEGRLDQATGQLDASTVELMPRGGRPMELHGSVTEVLGAGLFVVRGQRIDASRAQFAGGSAAMMAAGRYVEVAGTAAGSLLAADRVDMPSALPEQAMLELTGTVVGASSVTQTVQLLLAGGQTMTMRLDGMTSLPSAGDMIRVAGVWRQGVLMVQQMSRTGMGMGMS